MNDAMRRWMWGIVLTGAITALVLRVTKRKHLAVAHRDAGPPTEAQLDEMIEETFPASDPPGY